MQSQKNKNLSPYQNLKWGFITFLEKENPEKIFSSIQELKNKFRISHQVLQPIEKKIANIFSQTKIKNVQILFDGIHINIFLEGENENFLISEWMNPIAHADERQQYPRAS